jgi:hypothetical protein
MPSLPNVPCTTCGDDELLVRVAHVERLERDAALDAVGPILRVEVHERAVLERVQLAQVEEAIGKLDDGCAEGVVELALLPGLRVHVVLHRDGAGRGHDLRQARLRRGDARELELGVADDRGLLARDRLEAGERAGGGGLRHDVAQDHDVRVEIAPAVVQVVRADVLLRDAIEARQLIRPPVILLLLVREDARHVLVAVRDDDELGLVLAAVREQRREELRVHGRCVLRGRDDEALRLAQAPVQLVHALLADAGVLGLLEADRLRAAPALAVATLRLRSADVALHARRRTVVMRAAIFHNLAAALWTLEHRGSLIVLCQ